MAYSVHYTQEAREFILTNVRSKKVHERIKKFRDMLKELPELGRAYDPEYPASRPPFECRVLAVPDSPFALYYVVDEEHEEIIIFHVENQRMDPEERFAYAVVPW